MASPSAHAKVSPSAAHRWLNCTAAPTYEQQFPDETSPYAAAGTVAHAICEIFAKRRFTLQSNRSSLTRELNKLKKSEYYDPGMLDSAQKYVEFLDEKAMQFEHIPYVVTEVRVDLSDYIPEGFGSCDCVMIGGERLQIVDYKHGQGVPVDAEMNPQMMLYALGALKHFRAIYGDSITTVAMSICQPRINNLSDWEISASDLLAWGDKIKPLADAAFTGQNAEYKPGEWCRFCKGRAVCRARADQFTPLKDFAECVPEGRVSPEIAKLPPEGRAALGVPHMLTDEQVGELLTLGAELTAWYKDLQDYALQRILDGKAIPGYKVVAGKSNRVFTDEAAALKVLTDSGYGEDILYERKVKSLTAIEKNVGKKNFGVLMADYITKPLGKPTLVEESDKREPYSTAQSDFAEVRS
jgi:hypothetical protein